jgi:hypothetical protein
MDNYFAYLFVFLCAAGILLIGDLIINAAVYAIFADTDQCTVKNFRAGYYTFFVPIVLLATLVLGSKQSVVMAKNNFATSRTTQEQNYYSIRVQKAEKFENTLTDGFKTLSGFRIK